MSTLRIPVKILRKRECPAIELAKEVGLLTIFETPSFPSRRVLRGSKDRAASRLFFAPVFAPVELTLAMTDDRLTMKSLFAKCPPLLPLTVTSEAPTTVPFVAPTLMTSASNQAKTSSETQTASPADKPSKNKAELAARECLDISQHSKDG